jgi:hypothetical protein
MVIPKENCEDSAPCRTPDGTILLPVISFSLLCGMSRNHCAISPEFAFAAVLYHYFFDIHYFLLNLALAT